MTNSPARALTTTANARARIYSIADVDYRHGLRVAVISMADELHFGLCADPAIVGELEPLVDGIRAEDAALAARSRGDALSER